MRVEFFMLGSCLSDTGFLFFGNLVWAVFLLLSIWWADWLG